MNQECNNTPGTQSPEVTRSGTPDATESDVGSGPTRDNDQILKILESHDPSHLIDESYKKFKAELGKIYVDSQRKFKYSLPNVPEDESLLKTVRSDVLYEESVSMFMVYLFVVSISLMGYYATSVIESSMISKEVSELIKLFSPFVFCLMAFYLVKDKLSSYF